MNQSPSSFQLRVLRGILGNSFDLQSAFEEIQGLNSPDLPLSVMRLLPFLQARMSLARPELLPLKGIEALRERIKIRNTHLLECAEVVQKILNSFQINSILLKGANYLNRFYRDLSIRTMSDVDIWVPKPQAAEAVHLLLNWKWTSEPSYRVQHSNLVRTLKYMHALDFSQNGYNSVDLHWHAFNFCPRDALDRALLEKVRPIGTYPNRFQLGPSDELLVAIVHGGGSLWEPDRDFRWVIDVLTLIRELKDDLDWDRIVHLSREFEFSFILNKSLRFLTEEFGAEVPIATIEKFKKIRATKWEKWEDRVFGSNNRGMILGILPRLLLTFRRFGNPLLSPSFIPRFIDFLGFVWNTRNPGATIYLLMTKSLRRFPHALKLRS